MSPLLALAALLIEAVVGYPDRLFGRIGHPVTWIGALISRLDRSWNLDSDPPARRRRAGRAAIGLVLAVALSVAAALQGLAGLGWSGFFVAALAASALLAQRSLEAHVRAVADALESGGLLAGRAAVARIVGRDPDALDEAGVCRAAIESLAENFSDGIVAPTLWLAALGAPGGCAYKAINTADSMIGHLTPRHGDFGRAAARFDDAINWPAARLSGGLIAFAAVLASGATAGGAWGAMLRDARSHRSPNAGWPEAAMAGALGLSLAGPRRYGGEIVTDAEMNAGGRRDAGPSDIRRALRLCQIADGLLIALIAVWALAVAALT